MPFVKRYCYTSDKVFQALSSKLFEEFWGDVAQLVEGNQSGQSIQFLQGLP